MEYKLDSAGDKTELIISGRLTFAEHEQCRAILAELSAAPGGRQVVDLRGVEFIDSAGLGLLLLLREEAEKNGRNLSLRIPNDGQVKQMLDVSHFQSLIPIEN